MRMTLMSRYPPSPERSEAMRWGRARVLLAAVLLLRAVLAAAARALADLNAFPQSTLEIGTRRDSQRFNICIADTPARSQQDLMFVLSLPADRGMLFPLERPGV